MKRLASHIGHTLFASGPASDALHRTASSFGRSKCGYSQVFFEWAFAISVQWRIEIARARAETRRAFAAAVTSTEGSRTSLRRNHKRLEAARNLLATTCTQS